MKKLLILLFLLITTPSFADWKYVITTADDTADYYIDMDQIRKEGGLVYFWALTNLKKPDSGGDLSYIYLVQGDCKLFRVIFSGILHRASKTFFYDKIKWGGGNSSIFTRSYVFKIQFEFRRIFKCNFIFLFKAYWV